MTGPDPEFKRRFLEDVERWLDSLGDSVSPEEPWIKEVEGRDPTLFDLFSQMAALTQEVKLGNRTTNRLHGEITGVLSKLGEGNPAPAALAKARREGRMELVLEILDVRDRFVRGIAEASCRLERRPNLLERWAGSRPVLAALESGNRLALERLDETLRRLDIHEVPAAPGQPFDPESMKCVEADPRSAKPAGTLLEVIRPGFLSQGKVLRYAEVKVSGRV